MIVVTGGTGLVGSNIVRSLNRAGHGEILVVDSVGETERWRNLEGCQVVDFINYRIGTAALEAAVRPLPIEAIFHVGANADVLVRDADRLLADNFDHSKAWFQIAQERGVPLLYASSSAVYGNAPECRVDATCEHPHNAYAFSKWLFDKFVADRLRAGGLRAPVLGFRLFNVFGPGEEHKGANASLPRRFLGFLQGRGRIDLFEGDLTRDYVAVEAVGAVFIDAWKAARPSGIFNLGGGAPISHRAVAEMAVEAARRGGIRVKGSGIEVVPMPEALCRVFQFRTCAEEVPTWIQAHAEGNRERMQAYLRLLAGCGRAQAQGSSAKWLCEL